MRYNRISADSHIDLPWLPSDLFTTNATAALKDRMPHVVEGPDGPHWTSKKGHSYGLVCGVGAAVALDGDQQPAVAAAAPAQRKPQVGQDGLGAAPCVCRRFYLDGYADRSHTTARCRPNAIGKPGDSRSQRY